MKNNIPGLGSELMSIFLEAPPNITVASGIFENTSYCLYDVPSVSPDSVILKTRSFLIPTTGGSIPHPASI